MYLPMKYQITNNEHKFIPMAAIKRFLSSVSPRVYMEIPFPFESFVTMATLIMFLPSVFVMAA